MKNEVSQFSRLVYLNVMTITVVLLIVSLVQHDFGLLEQTKHVAIGPL